jgi:hypothetical protein
MQSITGLVHQSKAPGSTAVLLTTADGKTYTLRVATGLSSILGALVGKKVAVSGVLVGERFVVQGWHVLGA